MRSKLRFPSIVSALFLLACSGDGPTDATIDDDAGINGPDAGSQFDSGTRSEAGTTYDDAGADSARDAKSTQDGGKDGGNDGGIVDSGGVDSGGNDAATEAGDASPPPEPGTHLWTQFFNGGDVLLPGYQTPKGAGADAVAVDNQGFIWIVGHEDFYTGSGNAPIPIALKLDPEGALVFKRKPSAGSVLGTGYATGVVLDGQGAAFVTAEQNLIRYSAAGDVLLSPKKIFTQSRWSSARPRLLGTPGGSLVYVDQTTSKAFVIEIAKNGDVSNASDLDASFGMLRDSAIKPNGDVLLLGTQDVATPSGFRSVSTLVTTSLDGSVLDKKQLYAASFTEAAPTSRDSGAITVDASGHVYLAGREHPPGAASNHAMSIHWIERRTADGDSSWELREQTPPGFAYQDRLSAMAIDDTDLAVAGTQGARVAVLLIDSDSGDPRWRASLALGTSTLTTSDVAMGPGRVYVVGKAGSDPGVLFVAAFAR